MTPLTEKRIAEIKRVMRNWGIEHGDKCAISIWDLAENLINTWQSETFLSPAQVEKYCEDSAGRPVLNSWRKLEMFRGIRDAVKKSGYPLELRESYYNKTEFVLWKNYQREAGQ